MKKVSREYFSGQVTTLGIWSLVLQKTYRRCRTCLRVFTSGGGRSSDIYPETPIAAVFSCSINSTELSSCPAQTLNLLRGLEKATGKRVKMLAPRSYWVRCRETVNAKRIW